LYATVLFKCKTDHQNKIQLSLGHTTKIKATGTDSDNRRCIYCSKTTRGLALRRVQTRAGFDPTTSNKMGDQDLSCTVHLPSLVMMFF